MKSERQYKDALGNPCTLDWLVKNEPEWAANQIRHRDNLEIEIAHLRTALKAADRFARRCDESDTDLSEEADAAWVSYRDARANLESAYKLLDAVVVGDTHIYCNDVEGKNWFDLRANIKKEHEQ